MATIRLAASARFTSDCACSSVTWIAGLPSDVQAAEVVRVDVLRVALCHGDAGACDEVADHVDDLGAFLVDRERRHRDLVPSGLDTRDDPGELRVLELGREPE